MTAKKTRSTKTARNPGSKKKPTKKKAAVNRLKHKPTGHTRNYAQVAYEYAQEAVRDKKNKKFCKWVRLAAKRHIDNLGRRGSDWPYVFDEWHANDVCDFAEKMPHVEGEWDTPTITLEPAQVFILAVVFGWRRKLDGNRRFSRVYIEMARKNAKSTLSAIVALYCLACEEELGPQVIIGATTGEQANKVFAPAKAMASKTSEFREAFGVSVWARSVTCGETGGFIQPINSKSSTQDGWNPHCGILDELHAHKDRGLYDVIKSAFGARKNPLMWCITTAGYILNGVCYEQRKLVANILENIISADHYFGIIYTLDEGDNELDESTWIKANPLLGVAVQLEEMRGYSKEAVASPESMGEFKTKRLNIWTTAKNGWLNIELWKKSNKEPVVLKRAKQHSVYGGLDLSTRQDIAALVLLWEEHGRLKIFPRFYLPEETVFPRTERGNVPYQTWVDQGYLMITPGNTIDYDYIEKDIQWALNTFDVKQIGYDPWNASQLVNKLVEYGAPMVEMRQGPKTFHPAMHDFERRIIAGTVDHGDNPVLTWMAGNIVTRLDVNQNMAPDKNNSLEKIDGIVAALMANGRLLVGDEEETPGIIVL